MAKHNVIWFQPKDPKERAKWDLKQNPEKVLEQVTLLQLEAKDLPVWKAFSTRITHILEQTFNQRNVDIDEKHRNFLGLALFVFSTLIKYLGEWEKEGSQLDMVYPLSYLDFYYLTSYLNAGSEAFPEYHSFCQKYLDQVLPALYQEFEYVVELVIEYSTNLPRYQKQDFGK